jgi:hypothetical protein
MAWALGEWPNYSRWADFAWKVVLLPPRLKLLAFVRVAF